MLYNSKVDQERVFGSENLIVIKNIVVNCDYFNKEQLMTDFNSKGSLTKALTNLQYYKNEGFRLCSGRKLTEGVFKFELRKIKDDAVIDFEKYETYYKKEILPQIIKSNKLIINQFNLPICE